MGAVQGLYVEIDFKFKNEALMQGIKQVKDMLKTLGVDAQRAQKGVQQSGYRTGEVFKKISKEIGNTSKVINKSMGAMNKSNHQGALKAMDEALKAQKSSQYNDAVKRAKALNAEFNRMRKARIDKPLDSFNNKAKLSINLAQKINNSLKRIGQGALYKTGAFLATQAAQTFKEFGEIDFEIRGASGKTGGFEKDRKELLKLANKVGAETKFRNLDVAQAINAGASLGLKTKDLSTAIPSSSKLAKAFNSDLAQTIESTVAYLKTYKMEMSEMPRINDMVAVTAKNSAADLERLQAGFQYVGNSAKQMNIPIESTFAILGKLNDVGIQGSSAGTSLNNFIVQLSKNYQDVEKMIGQKLTDQNGKLKPIEDVFDAVGTKFKSMKTDTEKMALSMELFGIRGSKTFFTFLEQGTGDLRKFIDEIRNSNGTVEQMAKFMMAGSGGAIEIFLSTLESAFQSTFSALEPLIIPVAGALTLVARGIIEINEHFPELGIALALVASFIIGKSLFLIFAKHISAVTTALKGMSMVGFSKFLGWAAIIMLIYYAFKKFKSALDKDKEAQVVWQQVIKNSKEVLKTLVKVIGEFLTALFGLDKFNKNGKLIGDGPVKRSSDLALFLNNVREALRKTQEKLEGFSNWIKDNRKGIEEFGKLIKDWGPIMAVTAVSAWLLATPLLLLPMAIALIPVAKSALENTYKEAKAEQEKINEEIKKGGNRRELIEKEKERVRDKFGKKIPGLKLALKVTTFIPDTLIGMATDPFGKLGDGLKGLNKLKSFQDAKKTIAESLKGLVELNQKGGEIVRGFSEHASEVIKGIFSGMGKYILWVFTATFDSIVQAIKWHFDQIKALAPSLGSALQPFINKLLDALGILDKIKGFSGTVIEIGTKVIEIGTKVITNGIKQLTGDNGPGRHRKTKKAKETWTGTENFSGGYTTINEKGDELILGPTGMVVANNPSTMNIMTDLNNIKRNLSQLRFGNSENGKATTNNIVINIGNISNRSEVDYLVSQIDTLDLS